MNNLDKCTKSRNAAGDLKTSKNRGTSDKNSNPCKPKFKTSATTSLLKERTMINKLKDFVQEIKELCRIN